MKSTEREIKCAKGKIKHWKTIRFSASPKSIYGLFQAVANIGGIVHEYTKNIMSLRVFSENISKSSVKLNLCIATTEEILGEKGKSGTWPEIKRGITNHMGGKVVPAETALHLRTQYLNQPANELLLMAMEPFNDSYDWFFIFTVERYRNGPLSVSKRYDSHFKYRDSSRPEKTIWPPKFHWVFARSSCE